MDFVIIGNGVAGITAALTIRQREPRAQIAVISGENDYFFSRTALMYAYMDRMTWRDLEPYERNVWRKQRIDLVRDWVVDLNADSSEITLQEGGTLPYDRLLIATGSVANWIPWKGMDQVREGLVNFITVQDLETCERLTRPGRKAVVVGGGLIGVELVECMVHHKMDVTFLVREPWYWPAALGAEEGEMISEHIARHGVHLLHDESVNEVHSNNGKVTGVATESGKHFDCEVFGVTAGVRPAIEWLKSVRTPPEMDKGVITGPDFTTSLDNVWAAGDVAEIRRPGEKPLIEQIWYSAKRQGELAGRSILGDPVDYRPPVFYNSSKFFEIEFTTVGETVRPRKENPLACCDPEGARSFFHRFPGKEVCLRIAERNGSVIGFNMLGSRWNHTFFERWILERRSLDFVMEHLQEAQFDVEFGRQNLASAKADYQDWKRAVERSTASQETLTEG